MKTILPVLGALAILSGCAGTRGVQLMASKDAYERGLAEYQGREFKTATTSFTNAIRLNPNNHQAYLMRGKSRMRQIDEGDGAHYLKETGRAFDDFNMAIRILPVNFDAYYHRAVAFASVAKHRDAAYDLLNHCLKLRPKDPNANLLLAKVYDDGFEGYQAYALRYYEAYLEVSAGQSDPVVRNRVEELRLLLGKGKAAGDDEKVAAEMFQKAMTHVEKGENKEAYRLLQELKSRYGNTQVVKRNEWVIPKILERIQGDDKK